VRNSASQPNVGCEPANPFGDRSCRARARLLPPYGATLSLKTGEESLDPEDTFARHSHLLDSSADSLLALRGGAVRIQPNAAQASDKLTGDPPLGHVLSRHQVV
jgi:hypothetical protein